jgi:hypothetical protein
MAGVGEIRDFGGVGDFSQCELARREGFIILGCNDAGLGFLAADGNENEGG